MVVVAQLNVNNSRASHDLLIRKMEELDVSMVVITEPNMVPEDTRWYPSSGRRPTVAITWQGARLPQVCRRLKAGEGYSVVEWEEIVLVGCYYPPNKPLRSYNRYLDSLARVSRKFADRSTMFMGDFNARALLWDTV